MRVPNTSEILKQEIWLAADSNGIQRIGQLIYVISQRKVINNVIFEGIISVFEDKSRPETLYRDQKVAGTLLREFNPNTELHISEILNRVIFNWDKSVFELPLWFEKNYGREKTLTYLNDLLSSKMSEVAISNIKTFLYWLRAPKDIFPPSYCSTVPY